jgi:hypothetical protein
VVKWLSRVVKWLSRVVKWLLGSASLVNNTSGNGSNIHWGAGFSRNRLAAGNSGRWLHLRKDTPKLEYWVSNLLVTSILKWTIIL